MFEVALDLRNHQSMNIVRIRPLQKCLISQHCDVLSYVCSARSGRTCGRVRLREVEHVHGIHADGRGRVVIFGRRPSPHVAPRHRVIHKHAQERLAWGKPWLQWTVDKNNRWYFLKHVINIHLSSCFIKRITLLIWPRSLTAPYFFSQTRALLVGALHIWNMSCHKKRHVQRKGNWTTLNSHQQSKPLPSTSY